VTGVQTCALPILISPESLLNFFIIALVSTAITDILLSLG
jgi:hypothetical protein